MTVRRNRRGALYPRPCTGCGVPKAACEFSPHGAGRQPRCRPCRRTEGRAAYQRLVQEAPERIAAKIARDNAARDRATMNATSRAAYARRQSASLPSAERRGVEWAGWEFEAISDYSRTSIELAAALRRTVSAVEQQRSKLRRGDPKTVSRAGLPEHSPGF